MDSNNGKTSVRIVNSDDKEDSTEIITSVNDDNAKLESNSNNIDPVSVTKYSLDGVKLKCVLLLVSSKGKGFF